MLFITRKETEKVMLSNEVELQIVKIDEDRVQIGLQQFSAASRLWNWKL